MEHLRMNISLFFGLLWFPVQMTLTLVIAVIFFIWSATAELLPLNLKQKFLLAAFFWHKASYLIIKVGLLSSPFVIDRRSYSYKSNLTKALYISNHQSIWDIPLILFVYQIVPIMKKELMSVPLFGLVAKASTAIPVDRKNKDSRKQVVDEVKKRFKVGLPIQFYPEGTRNTVGYGPKPFDQIKTTLLDIAFQEKIPVIATSIWGTPKILNRFAITLFPVSIGIIVHKEINPNQFANSESFSRSCWEAVCTGYGELEKHFNANQ